MRNKSSIKNIGQSLSHTFILATNSGAMRGDQVDDCHEANNNNGIFCVSSLLTALWANPINKKRRRHHHHHHEDKQQQQNNKQSNRKEICQRGLWHGLDPSCTTAKRKMKSWERNAHATARSCVKKGTFSNDSICMRVTKVSPPRAVTEWPASCNNNNNWKDAPCTHKNDNFIAKTRTTDTCLLLFS